MVTAKTQYSLANAQAYFSEHLAVGDYYQEGQKVAGEWFGSGAESLGLVGKVGEATFLALCENQHPQTSHCLTQRKNTVRREDDEAKANSRIFYDFTFSPPKSVSIAALVSGNERIAKSHERAVRVALAEFEIFAATRVRKHKAMILASTGPRSRERGETALEKELHDVTDASTGPRSRERGESSDGSPDEKRF